MMESSTSSSSLAGKKRPLKYLDSEKEEGSTLKNNSSNQNKKCRILSPIAATTNAGLLNGSSSHVASLSSTTENNTDQDSDGVEFLFSLPPEPGHSAKLLGHAAYANDGGGHSDHHKLATTLHHTNDNDEHFAMMVATSSTKSRNITPSSTTARSNRAYSRSGDRLQFSHRSSAYLQTLAEISYAILWDARWRVGGSHRHRLFTWEQGEDLSALLYLSRRYCFMKENAPQSASSNNAYAELDQSQATSVQVDIAGSTNNNKHDDSMDDEILLDRCLETYCRLYFRKGPWFRLDNVYSSYYVRNVPRPAKPFSNDDTCQIGDTSACLSSTPSEPMSPSKFFLPTTHRRRKGNKERRDKNTGNEDIQSCIDQEHINRQLEAVDEMLDDITKLSQMGLIRFFHDEEECGKTVGNNERYPTSSSSQSSLLRRDEQRSVLTMLGGGKKQKRSSPPAGGIATSDFNTGNSYVSLLLEQPSENLIWKQMNQQQAIFQTFTRNVRNAFQSSNHLLPVTKHVHDVVIEKWANTIVLKASNVEYVPSAILRRITKAVIEKLNIKTATANEICSHRRILTVTCLRLRESPLETLRRACRLYLCATAGPGDMRGGADGKPTAWRSLPGLYPHIDPHKLPMRTNHIPPPGSNSWHLVSYPGKDWRMRLIPCNFIQAHVPLFLEEKANKSCKEEEGKEKDCSDANVLQVFASVDAFHSWETAVESRATVDYLLELNDLLHYTQRKQDRENANSIGTKTDGPEVATSQENTCEKADDEPLVDFLKLLTVTGRKKVIQKLLRTSRSSLSLLDVENKVEDDVCNLLGNDSSEKKPCNFKNESEKILGVSAVVVMHILEQNASIFHANGDPASPRPWHRHMSWEGCTAYLLWDLIPILERRGYYNFAINALEILLFGRRLLKDSSLILQTLRAVDLAPGSVFNCYISRRARGKAYERLIIDYIHFQRKSRTKETPKKTKSAKSCKKGTKNDNSSEPRTDDIVGKFIESLLQTHAPSGRITFAAIRTLARRLKRPLSHTLKGMELYETKELGHRLSNGSDAEEFVRKYSDWRPVADTAVANAINKDTNAVAGRCAYVGFEEDDRNSVYVGSLNVEQLAMEYYNQGRLPNQEDSSAKNNSGPAGGWIGYHDEGGSIRALFRILSSSMLCMDFAHSASRSLPQAEMMMIHLTPYQGAPFDLHVGAELSHETGVGFYQRRKKWIDCFLQSLADLDAQGVANVTYNAIKQKLDHATSLNHFDPSLDRDIQQARTLSMLAAGFGGKLLSVIFRCLFFDYRHYSGGLPDLTLFRAVSSSGELVDLGEWVGEKFSRDYVAALKAEQAAQVIGDDEFLGCSKVGDSGARNTNRFNRSNRQSISGRQNSDRESDTQQRQLVMPEKLMLEHNGVPLRVECMCVEVKSQNDRLDPRQEDWLNILSQYGNARICKFGKPKETKNTISNIRGPETNSNIPDQVVTVNSDNAIRE